MLSFDEALQNILTAAKPLETQSLPLVRAAGRYLAQAAVANITQPPFDASAMDGYAVRTQDVTPNVAMPVVGTIEAGKPWPEDFVPGTALRIFTGGAVPAGVDAVIIQENAERDGDKVTFATQPERGQNIRLRGNDFAQGKELITQGSKLTPAALALAAAANIAELTVHKAPRVAILATGDELVPPGAAPQPGQIIASTGTGQVHLFTSCGAEVEDHGICGDDEAELYARLKMLLDSDADVIITTGGASVGDKDLTQKVLKSLHVDMGFWRIAMRPGKPLMFGRYQNKLIFGLPGNPVSAMVTATMLVLPALRALAGAKMPIAPVLHLPLATALPANNWRRHFMRGKLVSDGNGTKVQLINQTDSAHLSSYAEADVLIVQVEDAPALPAGSIVPTIKL